MNFAKYYLFKNLIFFDSPIGLELWADTARLQRSEKKNLNLRNLKFKFKNYQIVCVI